MQLAIFVALLAAVSELIPSFGLSVFPSREDTWDSPYYCQMTPLRIIFAILVWGALLTVMWRICPINNRPFVVIAVFSIVSGLAIINLSYNTSLIGALLFTLSWLSLPYIINKPQLFISASLVLISGYTMSETRFKKDYAPLDYAGRIIYAFGIISKAFIISY